MPGNRRGNRGKGRSRRRLDLNSPARARALEVLSRMRSEKLSLSRATKRAQTSVRSVLKYAATALEKTPGGRYRAKPSDRLKRTVYFLTEHDKVPVVIRNSRMASRVASYWTAVDRFLKSGDASGLEAFMGKTIRVGKTDYPFVTDPDILERLGNAGVVSFEDLYASTF